MFAGPWTFQEPASLAIFWSELKYILLYITNKTIEETAIVIKTATILMIFGNSLTSKVVCNHIIILKFKEM